jgi:hypothetical protein
MPVEMSILTGSLMHTHMTLVLITRMVVLFRDFLKMIADTSLTVKVNITKTSPLLLSIMV